MRSLCLALVLIPLTALAETPPSALAETPMTPQDFETYTTGKTLTYGTGGQNYGVEEYLPNRRVRWSFLDGKCKDGLWYPQGRQICFVYEDSLSPQCWLFFHEGTGLSAQFASGDDPQKLYEIQQGQDMLCLGPEVGV